MASASSGVCAQARRRPASLCVMTNALSKFDCMLALSNSCHRVCLKTKAASRQGQPRSAGNSMRAIHQRPDYTSCFPNFYPRVSTSLVQVIARTITTNKVFGVVNACPGCALQGELLKLQNAPVGNEHVPCVIPSWVLFCVGIALCIKEGLQLLGMNWTTMVDK